MKKKTERQTCGVCLECIPFGNATTLCKPCSHPSTPIRTDCGHSFHQGCLESMVGKCVSADKCPICRQSILETIFLILNRDNSIFRKVGSGIMTCLSLTLSESWSTDCLEYLVSGGCRQLRSQKQMKRLYPIVRPYELNRLDRHGRSPLHACMMMMHKEKAFEIVILLLKWGSDPCAPCVFYQNTSLHLFFLYSYYMESDRKVSLGTELYPFFESLITHCKDVNMQNSNGATPLHMCMRIAEPVYMVRLLEKGADHNVEDSHGDTPLFYLLRVSYFMASKVLYMSNILIQRGANLDHKNIDGITPRMLRRSYLWRVFMDSLLSRMNGRCID